MANAKRTKHNNSSKTRTPREDVYTRVTNRIVEQLSQGVRPWLQPWNAEHAAGRISRPLRHNGEPYQGINILMLWDAAEQRGLCSPLWLTHRQAKELGGHVRKGERGTPVVYANTFKKTDIDEDGNEVDAKLPFLKEYTVFNAEQCEDLPERFYQTKNEPVESVQRIERADRFFADTGADIREGGNRAYCQITDDFVRLPRIETFRDAESHVATLAHELTHWTRHPSRLDRNLVRAAQNSSAIEASYVGCVFLRGEI